MASSVFSYSKIKYGKIESEQEFAKGYTTTGVLFRELFSRSSRKGESMITVNGKAVSLQEPIMVEDYLIQNQYQIKRIAVELNGDILPKSSYSFTPLKDGDKMEIVSFVGGG